MAIVGLGTDLSHAERFRKFLAPEKKGLLERLFTPGELTYCLGKRDPVPHLAARFAAKEAFLKALGLGLRDGMAWQDMEIVHGELGKPEMVLTGRAEEIFESRDLRSIYLSYSHDGEYATATVILEGA